MNKTINFLKKYIPINNAFYADKLPVFLLAVFIIFITAGITGTIFESLHIYGDSGGEANALMAAKHFQQRGFFAAHFMPIHNNGNVSLAELKEWIYTRYPPLPDIVLGFLFKAGFSEIWHLRILPTILTIAAIVFWFLFANIVFGSKWFSLLIVCATICNRNFLKMADSFYYMAYCEFFRIAIPYFFLLFLHVNDNTRKKKIYLFIAAILTFLNLWITFDYILFVHVMCLFIAMAFYYENHKMVNIRSMLWPQFLLGMVTFFAFFSRIIHNGWDEGAITKAVQVFWKSFLYRILNTGAGEQTAHALKFDSLITDLLRYTRHGYHIDTAFFVSFIFIAICLYVIRRQFSENFTSKIIICAGLLLASVSYILFLPQWAMHHYGLVGIKHVAPIFGLLTGSMLFFLGIVIYRNFFLLWHKVNIIKSLAVAIPAIFAFFFVSRSMTRNLNDTLSMWASASKPLGSWEFIFNDIQPVKDRLPPDAYVLGNAMWRPELRYFLNRRVQIVESMDDFTFKWVNDISRFDKKIKTDVNKLNIDTSDFPHALEALIKSSSYEKYCNAAQTSGYFLFYKRWGEPENGFFPNYLKHEKELMAKSVTMYDWLEKNAIKVSVNKKWRLYKLVRLPPWPSAKNELRL